MAAKMGEGEIRRTKGGIVHPRVERAIAKLGADISHARRVRRISADDFATRIGISRATLHRLETGDPGVSMNTLAMALHAIGRLDALSDIAAPEKDHVTMMQMRDQAPKRINRPRVAQTDDVDGPIDGLPDAANAFKGF